MNVFLGDINQFVSSMSTEAYAYVGVTILFLFFMIHIYSYRKEKQNLQYNLDMYTKVFQNAFDISNDALLILSDTLDVLYINQKAIELLGVDSDIIHTRFTPSIQFKCKREWETLEECIAKKQKKQFDGVVQYASSVLKNAQNKEIMIHLFIGNTVLHTKQKKHVYTTLVLHDITASKQYSEQEFKHTLTGLPNLKKAELNLPILYSKVHVENNKIALMLLHFDNFTRLRALLGHEQSNKILIQFSSYLNSIVSELNILVYHTFDNHFLLTVSNAANLEQIKELAREIQYKVASAYKLENSKLHLTVSMGISVYPDSGSTRQLLDNCYKALEEAERSGDGHIEIYMPEKKHHAFDELTLHNDMQTALEKGEFEIYYQPIVKADTQEIVSAEALIRWIHPTLGFIPPDVFIGLMEKTGFIINLGQYILEEVLKQQRRWQLFKFKQIAVSINLSMVEIATGDFVQHIKERLAYHQIDPALIKFEITEGLAMQDEGKMLRDFKALKKLGVSILLDDFGTGYTSFTYLKKFPADIIKIDKTLIDHIVSNVEDRRIVKAMIDMGHNLGMKIVVEGVENKEMVKILNTLGCDYIQGYYFSKPLPVFEIQELLRAT